MKSSLLRSISPKEERSRGWYTHGSLIVYSFPMSPMSKLQKWTVLPVTRHIGESESLKIYEENRITGYSRDIWGKSIGGFKKNTWGPDENGRLCRMPIVQNDRQH